MDLVAAPVDAPGFIEHAIFGEDLVDGRAPTRRVVFTEDVVKIAGQQGRYAGHYLTSSILFYNLVARDYHQFATEKARIIITRLQRRRILSLPQRCGCLRFLVLCGPTWSL